VTKVDGAAGTVTVAHGPVASMNWGAMTMTFKVKDKMLMEKFAVKSKVSFEFVQDGKDFVVTGVK
jgi:Cu(I)/Ag(I) efflux system protein CusF